MSSTVSCSSAAQSVAVSSRMPAQILATPTGCMMKSSPLARRWSAWRSQAKTNARSTSSRSISLDRLVRVLLDHREQVAEQDALVVGELGLRARRRVPRRGGRRAVPEVGLGGLRLGLGPPVAAPFAGFFLGAAVRDFVAAERVVRLLGARVPSLGADAAARFAAGFLARSLVLAFPPVRGSFGMSPSLERTPAASRRSGRRDCPRAPGLRR